MDERIPLWQWSEGLVDTQSDHFRLFQKENPTAVAFVGRPVDRIFPIQFASPSGGIEIADSLRATVERDLNFFILELKEEDPWRYLRYHCGTASNLYSTIRWAFFPAQDQPGTTSDVSGRGERN